MSDTPTVEQIEREAPQAATHYHIGLQVYLCQGRLSGAWYYWAKPPAAIGSHYWLSYDREPAEIERALANGDVMLLTSPPSERAHFLHSGIADPRGQIRFPSPKQPGMKFDTEKPRVDLLLQGVPRALLAVSEVLTYGASKYADHNWQKVENGQQRYTAALTRHQLAYATGERNDPESGLHHLAHAATNALFLLELALRGDHGPQE